MATASATLEKPERRSQAERRQQAERALLKAAVRIVAKDGLERFTLAEVGEAAGYSRGLPAHYFGSKDGLIGALARHIVRDFGRGLVRVEKHALGLERLLGTVAFYLDSAREGSMTTRALFAVLGEAITNGSLKTTIAELNARNIAVLEENIRAGIAAGDIRKGVNARAQAVLILSALRGAVAQFLTDPSVDLKAVRTEYLAALKRSLAP